jgi:hypothetical protein
MSTDEGPTKVSILPMVAGILIMLNAAAVAIVATWFIGIMPKPPGMALDAAGLHRVAAVGFVFGALVLCGAMLLRQRPAHGRAWGAMVIVFSILGFVIGGGFIVGSILGIVGGARAVRRRPGARADR